MATFLFLVSLLSMSFIAYAIIAFHVAARDKEYEQPPVWFLTISGISNIGMIMYFVISKFCN